MEVVNLVGDRLFLDYLMTFYFPFTYDDNHLKVNYDSYLDINDVDNKLSELQAKYNELILDKDKERDEVFLKNLQHAITIISDFKNQIN
jgi:hypothetical protein